MPTWLDLDLHVEASVTQWVGKMFHSVMVLGDKTFL